MLRIDQLVKTFEGDKRRRRSKGPADGSRVFAVDGVSLEVNDGDLFTLLGPSGCGKTTTLRSVAGLEQPDSGTIAVDDRVLFSDTKRVNVPANKRKLGMVFQSYAIWPHLTVFKNVSFPLEVMSRGERPSRKAIEERVTKVLQVTELGHLADRPATKLSGGQQQRLALARALVTEPDLMLLDEPLSNLDAKLRESMRFELKRLQRELGLTAVYVTHDQVEALALSTVIAVMKDGKIVQTGRPRDVYENPRNHFVADFIGTSNFLPGKVRGREDGLYLVDTDEGVIRTSHGADLTPGTDALLSLRPEHVGIHDQAPPGSMNTLRGTVQTRAFLGDSVDHMVTVGRFDVHNRSNPSISIEPGTDVELTIAPDKVTLIPVD